MRSCWLHQAATSPRPAAAEHEAAERRISTLSSEAGELLTLRGGKVELQSVKVKLNSSISYSLDTNGVQKIFGYKWQEMSFVRGFW